MERLNLVLTIPHGSVIATSLGVDGLAHHLSPGSGRHFHGRAIFVDLVLAEGAAAFSYLEEGGWRDAAGDTARALQEVVSGKRTKTALSSNGFTTTPLDAYRKVLLVKTGGQALDMGSAAEIARFESAPCKESMAPGEVAKAIGAAEPARREPRLYSIFAPLELLVLSNLTPIEYAWYATHRPGKVFRQVCFAELRTDQSQLAASSRYENARKEIRENPKKKTKTVAVQDLLNAVDFEEWVGYGDPTAGGLYFGDRTRLMRTPFPVEIPHAWEKAD
ncbi:MAG TPA: hypothetical protein VE129_18160 [Thermoanaerobaculia bacterium]|nr:hypothetical protein [Thermoanaerobaculia bacterium]